MTAKDSASLTPLEYLQCLDNLPPSNFSPDGVLLGKSRKKDQILCAPMKVYKHLVEGGSIIPKIMHAHYAHDPRLEPI